MTKRCIKLSTLQRLRGGPVGPFLDGFAESLLAQGYGSDTRESYLHAAAHVGEWTARCGSAITAFDETLLVRFVRHLPRRCRGWKRGGHKRMPFRVHVFLRYLRGVGVVTTSAPAPTASPLVTEYRAWMRDQRGLSAMTITHSLPVIQALLDTVADAPASLDAAGVRRFVLAYIQRHAPASAGGVTTIIRCFLRWLGAHGRCATDVGEAVPKVPTWRLARLPRYLMQDKDGYFTTGNCHT